MVEYDILACTLLYILYIYPICSSHQAFCPRHAEGVTLGNSIKCNRARNKACDILDTAIL
jgi:hypothetical protein